MVIQNGGHLRAVPPPNNGGVMEVSKGGILLTHQSAMPDEITDKALSGNSF
jgi:hypothetical protein